MALPTSGQLTFRQIANELGIAANSQLSLRSMSASASKTVPDSVAEFYGYSAVTYGRLYGQSFSSSYSAVRVYYGASFGNISGSSEQLIGTMTSSPINISMRQSNGSNFTGSEFVVMSVYRRTKNTSGSWGSSIQDFSFYNSATYSADFSTYDYKLVLNDM